MMQFVYPEILYALFALAIPVLVHLFNFRRFKRVAFSNVSFLKEVRQETQSKSRLKHLLILVTRMLAMAAIIFAFAQPYIPVGEAERSAGQKAVSIYIDNSFSMDAQNEGGRVLDIAKNKALEIVDAYEPTDQFMLLTNDFEGRHQFWVSKDEMIEFIDDVQSSSTSRPISDVISRQSEALLNNESEGRNAYLISDLQESTHDLDAIVSDSTISYRMVPEIGQTRRNIYIDSVWFDAPVVRADAAEKIHIRIAHNSDEELKNLPVKLSIDGVQKAVASFDVIPGEFTDTSLVFTVSDPGFHKARIEIQDHPITFDDSFFFSFSVAERIRVMEISSGNTTFVQKIFEDDPYFEYQKVPELGVDYSALQEFDLIIVNGLNRLTSGLGSELRRAVEGGISALVIPGSEIDVDSYNEALVPMGCAPLSGPVTGEVKVAEINLEHFLFKDVFESLPRNLDLPVVKEHYKMMLASRSLGSPLLTLRGGDCFLGEFNSGRGQLYVLASALDSEKSNFAQHALFVTSVVRIAEFAQKRHAISYTIGYDEVVSSNASTQGDEPFHLTNAATGLDFLPGFRNTGGQTEIYLHGQPQEAGQYELVSSGTVSDLFSFNYARDESQMTSYDAEELSDKLASLGLSNFSVLTGSLETLKSEVGELNEGRKLWPTLILLALILLVVEILLIKLLN
ncbi:MAG: BatA and WFA domain-containing protein [Flavobacteriales bacterium]|nr:BatA and WFA domain-containing protein [Flavobacteriales bacterium]